MATLRELMAEKERRRDERRRAGLVIWLKAIVDGEEDEEPIKARVLAEHLARHPEDKDKEVNWIINRIVYPPPRWLDSEEWSEGGGGSEARPCGPGEGKE
jgi:hypothetical protein